jgi:hypothetical protein
MTREKEREVAVVRKEEEVRIREVAESDERMSVLISVPIFPAKYESMEEKVRVPEFVTCDSTFSPNSPVSRNVACVGRP